MPHRKRARRSPGWRPPGDRPLAEGNRIARVAGRGARQGEFEKSCWWVITHFEGKRRWKRIGATKEDKRKADRIAEKANAAIALGTFKFREEEKPVPADEALNRWIADYGPTLKPSTRALAEGILKLHLVPFFGSRDLRELREAELMAYVAARSRRGARRARFGTISRFHAASSACGSATARCSRTRPQESASCFGACVTPRPRRLRKSRRGAARRSRRCSRRRRRRRRASRRSSRFSLPRACGAARRSACNGRT